MDAPICQRLLDLSGCSYEYHLLAVVRDNQIVFVVDPKSTKHPDCLRSLDVVSTNRILAEAAGGDDRRKTGYGTFWSESIDYDDACANRFPVKYGVPFNGKQQLERGIVSARALRREVIYDVSTTTGATGYGGGRFVIRFNGQVVNLPNK